MPNSVINEIKKGTTVYDIQDKNAIANPSEKADGQILTYDAQTQAWVAKTAAPSGVSSVSAGNAAIAIGGSGSAPTVAVQVSADSGNGLSVKSNGLYAAATDLSGVEGRLDAIEGKEAGWDAKYDKPSSGIPDGDIASASVWNAKQDAIPANTYDAYGAATNAQAAVQANLDAVTAKISAQATSTNKLVSASEMGDAIEAVEAKQLYKTNAQGSFATKAELTGATTFYNANGTVATPTKNDVAYVLADESHGGKSAKYVVASVDPTLVWGFVITFSDVTFSQAQMDAIDSGMTSADKTKLNGIADNANNYSHPAGSAASQTSGLYKFSTDANSHIAGVTAVAKSDITALGIPAQDTTYSAATQSAAGLMSAADKTKVDNLHRIFSGTSIPSGAATGDFWF